MATLRILTAEGCEPCSELKQLLAAKRLIVETGSHDKEIELDVVDVTTDEGFQFIDQYHPDGVPAAYLDGKQCKISYEDDDAGKRRAVISCGVELDETPQPG